MPALSRHKGFTRFESLVNGCIVIATTLAVVLFVKREGYFQALISREAPSRNQLSAPRASLWGNRSLGATFPTIARRNQLMTG